MRESRKEEKTGGHWYILAICLLLAVFIWGWWLTNGMHWARSNLTVAAIAELEQKSSKKPPTNEEINTQSEKMFTELGQTGDAFGSLNALLTAIAGALVAWAGVLQYHTLKHARAEAKEEKKHRQYQQTESLLFHLLELNTRATEKFDFEVDDDKLKGTRALDGMAYFVYSALQRKRQETPEELVESLVRCYYIEIYAPSKFGPYFRTLFRTFQMIADADLDEATRTRFSNIARGQMSDGAVLLLALNGLTPAGYKFIPLIERFGLLEHMLKRYKIELEHALTLYYRKRAFLGSKERAEEGNEWHPTPLIPINHFESIVLEYDRIIGEEITLNLGYDPRNYTSKNLDKAGNKD